MESELIYQSQSINLKLNPSHTHPLPLTHLPLTHPTLTPLPLTPNQPIKITLSMT
jgi:hypothetical protein